MHRSRPAVGLLAALVATVLTACTGGTPTRDAATAELEQELAAVPGVEAARARHHPGDHEYVSLTLDLGAGTHALATKPVIEATRSAVERSEHRDQELMVTLAWGDDDHRQEMSAHGPARMLGALSNETRAMAVVEQHGFARSTLSVSDRAMDAQYRRSVDVTLPAGVPGRALDRVRAALETQLPDVQQETDLSVRYHDHDPTRPTDSRSLRADAGAPEELLAAADSYLRRPVPAGWVGASDVYVSVSGYGTDPADWYLSVDVTAAPSGLWSTPEDELADHAGDGEVMDVGHHAARTVAPGGSDLFLDLRLRSSAATVDVAGFYSGDCAAAWEDRSGRSRALWRTWVEAGGRPGNGATATECPDA